MTTPPDDDENALGAIGTAILHEFVVSELITAILQDFVAYGLTPRDRVKILIGALGALHRDAPPEGKEMIRGSLETLLARISERDR